MRHWSQLGIRNWRVRPGRTAGGLAAIALGVGVVIWVTCAYESVRLALQDQVWFWTGRSHLSVESPAGPEGTIQQSLEPQIARLENVGHVTSQLRYYMLAQRRDPKEPRDPKAPVEFAFEVAVVGTDPKTEPYFRQYDPARVTGRPLKPGDKDVAMVENSLAEELKLQLGGDIFLVDKTPDLQNPGRYKYRKLKIIGLFEHRRVAKQQHPVVVTNLDLVQQLSGYDQEPKKVTKIDVILKDPSLVAIQLAEKRLRALVQSYGGFSVTSAAAKLRQVSAAEQQTSFVLLLISTVALFTAFFVILSTLSMGMVERIGQLGTLRCLGTTRGQLAAIVLAEAVPLGVAGVILGIPVGLALAKLSVILAPQYVGQFAISVNGIIIALIGGGITTLIGAILPMLQAMRVSPLSASRPQAKPPLPMLDWITGAIGLTMIGLHTMLMRSTSPERWFENPTIQQVMRFPFKKASWQHLFTGPVLSIIAVVLLYCGYALVTPLLVRLIGRVAVYIASGALRVRHKLLSDQVGRATWRSAAICCGLMVGLSLIVSLVVFSRSVAAGWDFPKNFCEAFVHVAPPIPWDAANEARKIPGIESSAIINVSTQCSLIGKGWPKLAFPWSRFISGDPDEFFKIAKLQFLQDVQSGKPPASPREEERLKNEAIAKLKKGGYILVTSEYARSQDVGTGDRVRVTIDPSRAYSFEVAGVVTSPALDIAANYFNAGGMLASQSQYVALGTQRDLQTLLRSQNSVSMFLINFGLPPTPPPAEFQAETPSSDIWLPGPFSKMVETWAGVLPERSREVDTIRRQLALAKTPHRPESELEVPPPAKPIRPGNQRKTSPASDPPIMSRPTAIKAAVAVAGDESLNYSDMPMLDLFKKALGEEVYPQWKKLTPAERWNSFREELILRLVPRYAGAADEQHKSVRALKVQIDRDLTRATMIFTTIPMVALIVAALGVGNLMMANVTSRTRQIAMLRAVGATKWQITRLIIGEAVVLGFLGSALGLVLGLHAAMGINQMVEAIWGFRPEWTVPRGWVTAGISFTMGVCLIAGIIPARRAARNNIIDALQTT